MYTIKYENIIPFLLGGKADFVVINTTTNNHLNFTINKKEFDNDEYIYYVFFKSHKNIYLGFLNKTGTIFTPDWKVEEVYHKQRTIFGALHNFIFKRNKYPNDIQIGYTGNCSKCGRILKNPVYIEMGIGKWCLENRE